MSKDTMQISTCKKCKRIIKHKRTESASCPDCPTDWDKGFVQGQMCVVAILLRNGHMDGEGLLHETNLKLSDLEEYEVDEYDAEVVRQAFKS